MGFNDGQNLAVFFQDDLMIFHDNLSINVLGLIGFNVNFMMIQQDLNGGSLGFCCDLLVIYQDVLVVGFNCNLMGFNGNFIVMWTLIRNQP